MIRKKISVANFKTTNIRSWNSVKFSFSGCDALPSTSRNMIESENYKSKKFDIHAVSKIQLLHFAVNGPIFTTKDTLIMQITWLILFALSPWGGGGVGRSPYSGLNWSWNSCKANERNKSAGVVIAFLDPFGNIQASLFYSTMLYPRNLARPENCCNQRYSIKFHKRPNFWLAPEGQLFFSISSYRLS